MPIPRSSIGAAFCLMASTVVALTSSASPADPLTKETKIRALMQAYLSTRPDTALSIGITYEGKCQYYNYGSISARDVNNSSVYEIGSISKTFAGLMLAKAIAERRVRPDDDVRKYLAESYPNLEYKGEPIRLLHLANMTSSLPDNLPDLTSLKASDGNAADAWDKVRVLAAYTRKDFLRDLHSVMLAEKPGNNPAHSNTAVQLLGYVLEDIYGAPYDVLIARTIEKPLAMNTNIASAPSVPGHDETGKLMPALTMDSARASGGLRYSTADMLRYLQYQIAESSRAVVISHKPNWYTLDHKVALGYFWIIESPDSQGRRFRYSGGTFGGSSFCDFYPKRKLGLVLLSNRADMKAQDDLKKLSEALVAEVAASAKLATMLRSTPPGRRPECSQ